MLLTGGGILWYARHDAEQDADNLLLAAAKKVRRELKETSSFGEITEILKDEHDLTHQKLILLIVDAQGRIVQQSEDPSPIWPRHRRDAWRTAAVAMDSRQVIVGMPWESTERHLNSETVLLTTLGGIVLIAVTGGAWWLVGQALSPLLRLAQQANAVAPDNLRVRLAPSSRDTEIVALVDTLNGLLSRLSEAAAARGRFYAAASHELRTPLQALSGHLELALTRPREAHEYQDVVQEAHTQSRRLISLTQDLLLLNQLDSAPVPAPALVEVGEMCERALSQLAPRLAERSLVLQADWTTTLTISAPPHHLEMLIRNLLENAVKYASEGGLVRVSPQADTRTLEIFNTCDPIPHWDEKNCSSRSTAWTNPATAKRAAMDWASPSAKPLPMRTAGALRWNKSKAAFWPACFSPKQPFVRRNNLCSLVTIR